MMPRRGRCRRNTAHNAGDSVSAFSAEISMAQLIVTANWRNMTPDRPGMNPTGTNTDSKHQRNGDDRPGDLQHRLSGCLGRGKFGMLLHHPLDVFDNDDGIIHHDADGEHQASNDTVFSV